METPKTTPTAKKQKLAEKEVDTAGETAPVKKEVKMSVKQQSIESSINAAAMVKLLRVMDGEKPAMGK